MNRRRAIGIGSAVVLAGLGTGGVTSWATTTKRAAEDQQSQTPVVIIDKRVPKGADAATILASSHVGTVPRKDLATDALTSDSEVGTQVTSAELYPGDQLIKDRLAMQVDNGLPAGSVEYGVKLDAEAAVGGLVKAGDTVAVLLTFKPKDTAQPNTYATLASVPVTNVLTAAQTTDASGAVKSPQYVVTLALTADQSAQLLQADLVWLARPVVK
jgi:pilus assembly protein CpaB